MIISWAFFLSLTLGLATAEANSKYIVRFKAAKNTHPLLSSLSKRDALKSLTRKVNSKKHLSAQALEEVNVMLVEGNEEEIKELLGQDPSVAYIEKDQEIKLAQTDNFAARPANSPYLNTLGLNAANPAHDYQYNGNDPIIVAVIDTGVNYAHPYLAPMIAVNKNEIPNNGIDDDGNGFIDDYYGGNVIGGKNGDALDVYNHGTHVAGLVKVVRDQALALGYTEAQRVQILPIRFFYSCGGSVCGTTSGAILALNYALSRGASVVNMSWGSEGAASYSQALYETLVDLYTKNISLVAAAGNSAKDTDSTPFFPASLSPSIPGLISVNSITSWHLNNGDLQGISLSSFSNFGKNSVDVASVGSSIFNGNTGLLSANAYFPDFSGNKFVHNNGTSMAAPLIAGIAAVMRSINPGLTAYDIKNLIVSNATVPRNFNNEKILANKNRADGYAHALNSFIAADNNAGSGMLPLTSSPVYSSNNSSSEGAGGCGAITSPGNLGGGPFGGNSMGLFTALFFAFQFSKRMRYKLTGVRDA